jgi:hypothetical protein
VYKGEWVGGQRKNRVRMDIKISDDRMRMGRIMNWDEERKE